MPSAKRRAETRTAGAPQPRNAPPAGPRVFVQRDAPAPRRTAAYRRAVLTTLARAAPQVRGDVTLVFVPDRTMQSLNRRYRGRNRTTDVLSFALGDGGRAGEPFGDVVISMDAARRQARGYNSSVESEVTRLVVHGTLHLCGFDHHERREAARMHGMTRRLLRALRGARARV